MMKQIEKRISALESTTSDKPVLIGLGEIYKELRNPDSEVYKSNQLLYDENRPHPNPSHPENIKYYDKKNESNQTD